MTPHVCPHCRRPIDSDPIGVKVAELRAACEAAGVYVSADDFVREPDAAWLLGLSFYTLRNRRLYDQPLPFRRLGRTAEYALVDLAARMLEMS